MFESIVLFQWFYFILPLLNLVTWTTDLTSSFALDGREFNYSILWLLEGSVTGT